jgi:hypothetical protein
LFGFRRPEGAAGYRNIQNTIGHSTDPTAAAEAGNNIGARLAMFGEGIAQLAQKLRGRARSANREISSAHG